MPRLAVLATLLIALPAAAQAPEQWNPLGDSFPGGPNDYIAAVAIAADGTVYVGGQFSTIGATAASNVAKWDPVDQTWSPLGTGTNARVFALAIANDGTVYVGGQFSLAGGVASAHVARWEPTANGGAGAWGGLNGGVAGTPFPNVHAIEVDAAENVYVGGSFSSAGGVVADNIAIWNLAGNGGMGGWSTLGDRGVLGDVFAIEVASDGTIYVGGSLSGVWTSAATTAAAALVVRFDPAANGGNGAFSFLGGGLSGGAFATVRVLEEWAGGAVFVGGRFSQAGGSVSASNLALWNPTANGGSGGWSALGAGTSEEVRALALGPDGVLSVGGFFQSAGGMTTPAFARWDPAGLGAWSTLSSLSTSTTFPPSIEALAVAPTGAIYGAGLGLLQGPPVPYVIVRYDAAASQAGVTDQPGWRLLAPPVDGLTVHDLASLNLVQGVPAGSPAADFPAEYVSAQPNLYTGYGGGGPADYVAAAATDEALAPGGGVWWYLFDQAAGPFAGGTSASVDLAGFILDLDGTATPGTRTVGLNDNNDFGDDDWVLLGNPFDAPFGIDGLSVSNATLQGGAVSAYQPGTGYQILFAANPGNAGAPDLADVWQGFFAELTPTTPGGRLSVTYDVRATDPTATPVFVGRAAARPMVQFLLEGETAGGAPFADEAAYVRLAEAAADGWDALDLSKLEPPSGPYALVAPVVERDGAPHRLAVDARPLAERVEVPLAVRATDASTVTLTWETAVLGGRTVVLTDRVAGQSIDLTTADRYTFTTDATDWADRFTLTLAATSVDVPDGPASVPSALSAPSPNPSAGGARLQLSVGAAGRVEVTVFDVLGRRVATLHEGPAAAGALVPLAVEAGGLAPGAYVVRARVGEAVLTRSLIVAR